MYSSRKVEHPGTFPEYRLASETQSHRNYSGVGCGAKLTEKQSSRESNTFVYNVNASSKRTWNKASAFGIRDLSPSPRGRWEMQKS